MTGVRNRSLLMAPGGLLLGALACCAGCGGSLPAVSEPAKAGPILSAALDAWKRGEAPASLATAVPPVRVIDHEWQVGWGLQGYEIKGEAIPYGLNARQAVDLALKSPKGKSIKKTVTYLVGTGPPSVITREDLDGE